MTADDAALYDERDDALLRAERAEIERDEAESRARDYHQDARIISKRLGEVEAELVSLRNLRDRWLSVTSAETFELAVDREANAYHEGACRYKVQRDKAEADNAAATAELIELRKYVAGVKSAEGRIANARIARRGGQP